MCARTCDWRSGSVPPVYTLYRALLPTIQSPFSQFRRPNELISPVGPPSGAVRCGVLPYAALPDYTEPEPTRWPRPPKEEGEAARNNVVMSAGKRSCPDIICYLLSEARVISCVKNGKKKIKVSPPTTTRPNPWPLALRLRRRLPYLTLTNDSLYVWTHIAYLTYTRLMGSSYTHADSGH